MKRLLLFLTGFIVAGALWAQVPQGISHQAVMRNAQGELLAGQAIGIRVSILQGSIHGPAVFVERHEPVSNANGLITYIIGQGDVLEGVFAGINWADGPYFLKTEADPAGGTNYTIEGVTELLAVPYALHAQTAATYDEADPLFQESPAAGITADDVDNWNEAYDWGDHADAGYLTEETQTLADVLAQGNDGSMHQVRNIADPTDPPDAATKAYVDILLDRLEALELESGIIVADADGNTYGTITIGDQVWMRENLRVSHYRNGDPIPTDLSDEDWENTTDGAFAIYPHETVDGVNSDEEMIDAYGKLYNWYAVNDARGLCPAGWSVASDDAWTQLVDYVVAQGFLNEQHNPDGAGNALKSCRQIGHPEGGDCDTSEHPRWSFHDTHHGFDAFGFLAHPGGYRDTDGNYDFIGIIGLWWSSSESSPSLAWRRSIFSNFGNVFRFNYYKRVGFSVRCIKDLQTSNNLTLAVNPADAGTVILSGQYEPGSQFVVAASANEGWEFVNWTGPNDEVVSEQPNFVYTMPGHDITLTANFQEQCDIIYGDGVTDIDGNEYATVIIGNQEWMAENLRVTKYKNGDPIPMHLIDEDWETTTQGAYAVYQHEGVNGINSDQEMIDAYGKLYNWYAVHDARGLCPAGWSVASDDEWTQLVNYVVAQGYPNEPDNPNGAGNALKSCLQVGSPLDGCDTSDHPRWDEHNTNYGFDAFGFSALPGGFRDTNGSYFSIGNFGTWWSSIEESSTIAWSREMFSGDGVVYRYGYSEQLGCSVRCVRVVGN